MKKQTVRMVIGMILIAAGLTGCGRTDKDEIEESLNDLQETASGTDGDEVTADGGIPENLSYSITPEGKESINVEADVISAGFENAPVYEAEVIEIDEALIAEYADRLFDNAKYEVVKPYNMYSMQELKDEREIVVDKINAYNGMPSTPSRLFDDVYRIDLYIKNFDESNVAELDELADGQLIYEVDMPYQKIYSSSSNNELVKYSSSKLRGSIDGEQWELFYEAIDGGEPQQSIRIYSCESAVEVYDDPVSMNDEATDEYGENLSDFETSQKAAEDMVDRLGYDNMEIIRTGQLVHYDYSTSSTNGYKFTFAKSIGTIKIGYKNNSIEMIGEKAKDGYQFGVQQGYIHVYVSDNKVYSVTIDNVIKIGDMLSEGEQNSLLSFDEIDSIAREFMGNGMMPVSMVNGESTDSIIIDRVCLNYLVLPSEEGKYSLIPVWLYYLNQPKGFTDFRFVSICINAVDGSIIDSLIPTKFLIH